MLACERQRGGIDGIREIRPVAGVAGEIEGAAQNQHQRDGGCTEQHEDVAAVVVAKAPKCLKELKHGERVGLFPDAPHQIDKKPNDMIYK